MTKRNESIPILPAVLGGTRIDLFEPKYEQADRDLLEELQSRLNVAKTLIQTRVAMGLSQQELGARAGTNQARVSELEAMKGNLRFDTLDRVSRAAGLMITLAPRQAICTWEGFLADGLESTAIISIKVEGEVRIDAIAA